MLTTHDNPYDPFDEFHEWFLYDIEHHYYSCSRLDRITEDKEGMTQREEIIEMERAIDEIIFHDDANIFKKVSRPLEI